MQSFYVQLESGQEILADWVAEILSREFTMPNGDVERIRARAVEVESVGGRWKSDEGHCEIIRSVQDRNTPLGLQLEG